MLEQLRAFQKGGLKQVETKVVHPGDIFQLAEPKFEKEHIFTEEELATCEINLSEIEILQELGKGSQGLVLKGKLHGEIVAVKKLHHRAESLSENELLNFRQEVAIMRQLRHPKVVQYLGGSTSGENLMLVTEFMEGGNLENFLQDKSIELSFFQKMKMANDIALAMNWLHNTKPVFIHRDLKTSNVLLDRDFNVKICDFGLTHVKRNAAGAKGHYGLKGTPYTIAPEVFRKEEYSEKTDIYSFSIVLWELLTRESPYSDETRFPTTEELIKYVLGGGRPIIPKNCPERLERLLTACWDNNPDTRPPFQEIVPELEAIMISDEDMRMFWRTSLGYEYTCKLDRLIEAMAAYLNADVLDPRFKMLSSLLAPINGYVTVEHLTNLLSWFGPFSASSEKGKESPFLQKLDSICTQPWFHGSLSREETLDRLADKKAGTFLVRLSLSEPGSYVVAYVEKQGGPVKQLKVARGESSTSTSTSEDNTHNNNTTHEGQLYLSPDNKFDGILPLVEYYTTHQPDKLNTPCVNAFLDRIERMVTSYDYLH